MQRLNASALAGGQDERLGPATSFWQVQLLERDPEDLENHILQVTLELCNASDGRKQTPEIGSRRGLGCMFASVATVLRLSTCNTFVLSCSGPWHGNGLTQMPMVVTCCPMHPKVHRDWQVLV